MKHEIINAQQKHKRKKLSLKGKIDKQKETKKYQK